MLILDAAPLLMQRWFGKRCFLRRSLVMIVSNGNDSIYLHFGKFR